MLKEILSALTGSMSTTGFSLPASNGFQGIPASQTFKNFFSNFTSSFTNGPGTAFPQGASSYTGAPTPAIDYYKNIQSQFMGQAPGQFISHNAGNIRNQRAKGRAFSPGALVPGAVIINSAANDFPYGGQMQPPLPQGQGSLPMQALLGIGAGASGLQGFAGQNSIPTPGNFPNGAPQFQPQGMYQQTGFLPQGGGIGGIISTLIFPIINLFGVLKSLFQMKNFLGVAKPLKVDTNNLSYKQYQDYLNYVQTNEEGSFDDYDHYIRKETNLVSGEPQVAGLQEF